MEQIYRVFPKKRTICLNKQEISILFFGAVCVLIGVSVFNCFPLETYILSVSLYRHGTVVELNLTLSKQSVAIKGRLWRLRAMDCKYSSII